MKYCFGSIRRNEVDGFREYRVGPCECVALSGLNGFLRGGILVRFWQPEGKVGFGYGFLVQYRDSEMEEDSGNSLGCARVSSSSSSVVEVEPWVLAFA